VFAAPQKDLSAFREESLFEGPPWLEKKSTQADGSIPALVSNFHPLIVKINIAPTFRV